VCGCRFKSSSCSDGVLIVQYYCVGFSCEPSIADCLGDHLGEGHLQITYGYTPGLVLDPQGERHVYLVRWRQAEHVVTVPAAASVYYELSDLPITIRTDTSRVIGDDKPGLSALFLFCHNGNVIDYLANRDASM